MMHDIGKIGVLDSILKKPAELTEEEHDIMKKHSGEGWAIVRLFPRFDHVSYFVLHHHAGYDGKSYPGGLRGSEIPLGARIIAVIDDFDAMVSSRPNRRGLPVKEVLRP